MFRAATWNVHHGSSGRDIAPHVRKFLNMGVDILLLQEMKKKKGVVDAFVKNGYKIRHVEPEFAIAWNPNRFSYIRHRRILMSPIKYWTFNYALVVVLRDKKTGKRIKCMSYHPPAHVQVPRHKTFRTVSRVLRDVVEKWNRIARRSKVDACLFGGDDNVDESKGWAPADNWRFMLEGPLQQITAPEGTHGKRRIDDFRIRGLRLVKKVGVFATGSDHKAFVADFDYR